MNVTLGELREDLNSRISASINSGFWKDSEKNSWINQAGQRVCDFKRWKWLELALTTQTRDDREYYDYPVSDGHTFKNESIYQIKIEGEDYPWDIGGRRRVNWDQFQKAKQMDSDEKIFANHNGFYFLHPIPPNGKEISIYGLKTWRKLLTDDDVAITPEEVYNEAIVRTALATALRKSKKYNEAKAELVEIFDPQVGVLALTFQQENDEAPKGYGGDALSSRWN